MRHAQHAAGHPRSAPAAPRPVYRLWFAPHGAPIPTGLDCPTPPPSGGYQPGGYVYLQSGGVDVPAPTIEPGVYVGWAAMPLGITWLPEGGSHHPAVDVGIRLVMIAEQLPDDTDPALDLLDPAAPTAVGVFYQVELSGWSASWGTLRATANAYVDGPTGRVGCWYRRDTQR